MNTRFVVSFGFVIALIYLSQVNEFSTGLREELRDAYSTISVKKVLCQVWFKIDIQRVVKCKLMETKSTFYQDNMSDYPSSATPLLEMCRFFCRGIFFYFFKLSAESGFWSHFLFFCQVPYSLVKSPLNSVPFQASVDNRHNFSNDQAFHCFKRQR